jgi:hypothetical protein
VRIRKLGPAPEANFEPGEWEDYQIGQKNPGVSVPTDYWLEGYLRGPIEVGKPVVIDRTSRNGVEISGLFESSPVVAILDGGFETENSVYQLEVVEGRSPDLG